MDNVTGNCDCDMCRNDREFEVSEELMQDLLNGNVALFAGAGISTEARTVLNTTFYESVAQEMGQYGANLTFPDLMSDYCRQPNGRLKLLQRIKERFDLIDSFPELLASANRFHRELGTFFPIRDIITTNWDTYFERFCHATPFVSDPDLAFWNAASRRVLKIHGSIANFSSIIATSEDYAECEKRLLGPQIIGAFLKTLLATQTVLFIGYSLSDPDFATIYELVKKQMDMLHRQPYVVTPFLSEYEKFRAAGLIPIQTDGTYFIAQVKKHAVAKGLMLPDEIFSTASELLNRVTDEHFKLYAEIKASVFPEVIFVACYQDGLMHALSRALRMRSSGEYSNRARIVSVIHSYLEWQKQKLTQGVYEDVAYMEGYINGLMFLSMETEERNAVPLYFLFGVDTEIRNIRTLKAVLKKRSICHKAAHRRAVKCLKRIADPDSTVFHHPPWL